MSNGKFRLNIVCGECVRLWNSFLGKEVETPSRKLFETGLDKAFKNILYRTIPILSGRMEKITGIFHLYFLLCFFVFSITTYYVFQSLIHLLFHECFLSVFIYLKEETLA